MIIAMFPGWCQNLKYSCSLHIHRELVPCKSNVHLWTKQRASWGRSSKNGHRRFSSFINHAAVDRLGQAADAKGLSLNEILDNLRKSLGINNEDSRGKEAVLKGKGRHLGINVIWSLRFRPDGAFCEDIKGKELGFKWGFDGGEHSSCWEMDSSGVSRSIECDDHEALLVGAWVRTGCWLQPHLLERFDVHMTNDQLDGIQGNISSTSYVPQSDEAGQPKVARDPPKFRQQQKSLVATAPAGIAPDASTTKASSITKAEDAAANISALQVPGGKAKDASPTCNSDMAKSFSSVTGNYSGSMVSALMNGFMERRVLMSKQLSQLPAQPATITLRLKGGKILNRVKVCTANWVLLALEQPLCGDTEAWEIRQWNSTWQGLKFPAEMKHYAVGGGQHVYKCEDFQLVSYSPMDTFQLPITPLLPMDSSYDTTKAPQVPVWRASSGHILIRPKINSSESGFMVVDTGASGFVISPKAAVSLGLDVFGELFAASISGKIPAQFIKAKTWSLGPLTIHNPVMMTMDLNGLVRGGPGEVIGIVGYDIFRRAVVEMPPMLFLDQGADGSLQAQQQMRTGIFKSSGKRAVVNPELQLRSISSQSGISFLRSRTARAAQPQLPPFTMSLYNPDSYCSGHCNGYSGPENEGSWSWYPLKMIACLPHIEVSFPNVTGSSIQSVLLMLDTGACGADIMLHARAVREMGLEECFEAEESQGSRTSSSSSTSLGASHYVRGVGGESGESVRVHMVELPWLNLAAENGVKFEQVKCMYAKGVGGLDISLYSGGIICGDLVARAAIAIDYSRKRADCPSCDLCWEEVSWIQFCNLG
ncbi:hypothetical protein CEUSTIGMA_g6251.t1 [Chlamydomonas eustigma]|uniref:Uncharacterized protein n=1 Tax=Chlamydomonas eustigma TaxID=1157962 RepID=A0A250X6U6_9CHLO|nr:hypothetical protein CEUSTIGMA_g6251.t1 [Chlamydomonas eustigma]|eukprot:GAX78814.1 hypothetical protein CEUSTIGMA_g6251.t1 [Chlamydomonas eustigma]